MSGKRLGSYRSGDRSEYLAVFGLSRVGFVIPAPRQEDFGVLDFLCILARPEGMLVFPESAFFVQVKSSSDDIHLDSDAVRWISLHMDHPLFICVCDKATRKMSIYSTARIWFALFLRTSPKEIVLKLDSDHLPDYCEMRESDGDVTFDVHVGPPVANQTFEDLEADPVLMTDILAAWIQMDQGNIARRRLGRVANACFKTWATNVVPDGELTWRVYHGKDYGLAERAVLPLLAGLHANYERRQDMEKKLALEAFIEKLVRATPKDSIKRSDDNEE